ncbi:alpha/beta hydrolase [Rhodococcus sp. BP-252]|uniref:alpha/beta fold hydrolase n=1 Tax=Nocardiaceae TaxID=85025 RepID=UPI000A0344F2|nr:MULTISPECIES: alpha/beta hydrolase [Rhodococcus]MBY6410170.1 alpha/beta hydrolase [Rhodococcus sp. BP-320]MBY6415139.1 alpha/beta hydrolase [Rhodococcus sp. BP-321]MBY6421462.1 alpha/beta hydrolase [Rhodococcus sp. BP-324]MBY6425553.1 alpha/beta hydrolase [Rhodococcus sp. BP-323]MBY6430035.1 alpha/beta hydrolase [Rhodococcus sp. BP-322]
MRWDDRLRRERLAQTRLGHDWIVLGRTRRALLRTALALIPLLLVLNLYWQHDVAPEQRRLASTTPQVDQIFDAADPRDRATAVVDMVGLGNVDAAPTAMSLPAFGAIGRVWAVRYDNRGIDTEVIGQLIAARAKTAGVKNVVLVGHSMGGVVALEVAQHLYEDSDVRVTGIVLDCTPLDLHAVRASSRDAGENLLRWIGWLPGARESRTLRTVVEMAARSERFVDLHSSWYPRIHWDDAVDAFDEVMRDKILNPSAASNGFIESQFRTIVASGALDNLDALNRPVDGKPSPAIVFMRPSIGRADGVVDVDYSQSILFDRVGGSDGQLRVVRMPGTGHANPRQEPQRYNDAVVDRVLPFLEPRVFSSGRSALPVSGDVTRRTTSPG